MSEMAIFFYLVVICATFIYCYDRRHKPSSNIITIPKPGRYLIEANNSSVKITLLEKPEAEHE